MKAIETVYSGVRFRSRLEARWAVFFDALGIKWEYEPEGYELKDGTRYLPDFLVRWPSDIPFDGRTRAYVEIKPAGDPFVKARKFAEECGTSVWLCAGEPACAAWPSVRWETADLSDEDGNAIGTESHLVEDAIIFHGLRHRPWFDASDDDILRFTAEAADAARAYRFWNSKRAA